MLIEKRELKKRKRDESLTRRAIKQTLGGLAAPEEKERKIIISIKTPFSSLVKLARGERPN